MTNRIFGTVSAVYHKRKVIVPFEAEIFFSLVTVAGAFTTNFLICHNIYVDDLV